MYIFCSPAQLVVGAPTPGCSGTRPGVTKLVGLRLWFTSTYLYCCIEVEKEGGRGGKAMGPDAGG